MSDTEWEGENAPEKPHGPTIEDVLLGKEYDGFPLRTMSVEALLEQGERGDCVNYVWPYEGGLNSRGNWKFHDGKVADGDIVIDGPKKPLMIDAASARAFKLVWNAINDANKEKTRRLLTSRGLTVGVLFEKIVWPNVSFGGRV